MKTCGVGISGKGMQDEDGIRSLGIEVAIGFVGNGNRAQLIPVFENEFIR